MGYRPTVRGDMLSRREFLDQPGGDIELQIFHGTEQELLEYREEEEREREQRKKARARARHKA